MHPAARASLAAALIAASLGAPARALAAGPVPAQLHVVYSDGRARADDTVELNARVVWSPATHRFALVRVAGGDGSCGVELLVVDHNGKDLMRKPLALGGADFVRNSRCQLGDKEVRRRVNERVVAANQMLREEGFVAPDAETGLVESDPGARASLARFASGFVISLHDGAVRLARGDTTLVESSLPRPQSGVNESTDDLILSAVLVRPARRVVFTWSRDGVRGLVDSGVSVLALPSGS